MANPSITPLPQAPNRAMARTVYPVVADAWAAAIGPWTTQVNDVVTWMGQQIDAAAASKKAAADSAAAAAQTASDAAYLGAQQVKSATDQAVAAKGSADAAKAWRDSTQAISEAVGADTGLPPTGAPGSVLRKKSDGSNQIEWGVATQVGDTVISTQPPDSTWLPTGKAYPQSIAPSLFAKLGTIADWPQELVSFGTTLGPVNGNNYSFISPAFGNGTYVTLAGSGGMTLRSTDAFATFVPGNIYNTNWYDIDFGSGKFVAVAGSGYFGYSTDGVNWAYNVYGSLSWRVRAGASNFVAVALGTATATAIMTSNDGMAWTTRAAPAGPQARPAFGAGLYALLATDGCYTSPDGVSWIKRPSFPFTPNGNCSIEYLAGFGFMAIDPQNARCATSADGVSWVSGSKLPLSGIGSLLAGQGGFLVAFTSSPTAYSSPDGIKWSPRPLGVTLTSLTKSLFVNRAHIIIPTVSNPTPIRIKPFSYDPTTQFWAADAQATPQGLTQYIKVN